MSRMRSPMAEVDYKAILDEAWQQHLALKPANAPTVISTFAGCGGLSPGYLMGGFRWVIGGGRGGKGGRTIKIKLPNVAGFHGDNKNLYVDQCLQKGET